MLEESRKSQGNIKSFRIPVVFSLFWFNLYYFKLQKFAQKDKKKIKKDSMFQDWK